MIISASHSITSVAMPSARSELDDQHESLLNGFNCQLWTGCHSRSGPECFEWAGFASQFGCRLGCLGETLLSHRLFLETRTIALLSPLEVTDRLAYHTEAFETRRRQWKARRC
ncbi:hypothetical protein OPV22_009643 [Ensete ventricosum]|uniref:Uncharacterized protein n=1 Tax=Ensete ventricosum TaxID=4639 RepID=A0AAV8RIZ9_ENSVE|nr:hypothetical protein OPV22_009643 [Ensete ventricosum]